MNGRSHRCHSRPACAQLDADMTMLMSLKHTAGSLRTMALRALTVCRPFSQTASTDGPTEKCSFKRHYCILISWRLVKNYLLMTAWLTGYMCTLCMAHCFMFLLVWFLILCFYDLISCGCRCLFRLSCIFFYIFFIFLKSFFITFLYFFRSCSFLCCFMVASSMGFCGLSGNLK